MIMPRPKEKSKSFKSPCGSKSMKANKTRTNFAISGFLGSFVFINVIYKIFEGYKNSAAFVHGFL